MAGLEPIGGGGAFQRGSPPSLDAWGEVAKSRSSGNPRTSPLVERKVEEEEEESRVEGLEVPIHAAARATTTGSFQPAMASKGTPSRYKPGRVSKKNIETDKSRVPVPVRGRSVLHHYLDFSPGVAPMRHKFSQTTLHPQHLPRSCAQGSVGLT